MRFTYAKLNLFYGSTSKVASKCFEFEAEIEKEGVLSFPAPLLFAAICMPHDTEGFCEFA